jgi:hypothetical protein
MRVAGPAEQRPDDDGGNDSTGDRQQRAEQDVPLAPVAELVCDHAAQLACRAGCDQRVGDDKPPRSAKAVAEPAAKQVTTKSPSPCTRLQEILRTTPLQPEPVKRPVP